MNKEQALKIALALLDDVNDIPNTEYLRGQAELLSDMYNMGAEFHVENSTRVLVDLGANEDTVEKIYGEEGLINMRHYNKIKNH